MRLVSRVMTGMIGLSMLVMMSGCAETTGAAYLYNEGDLHSPRRDGPTRLIRIEGKNMEKVQRFPYERVA